MGATRLASGKNAAIIQQNSYFFSFSVPTRDASPPLVLAFFAAPFSNLFRTGN